MSAIARILLRYIAAMLVAKGLLTEADGTTLGMDADVLALVETGLGLAISAATEAWFWLSRRGAARPDPMADVQDAR